MTAPSEVLSSATLRAIRDRFEGNPLLGHMLATTSVIRAARIATERAEAALAPLGLSMVRFEILGLIDSAGGRLSLRELKKATMLHPATMTGTIDALVAPRLVRRSTPADNRRLVMAELTPRGRATTARAFAALSEAQFGLPDLTEEQGLQVAEILGAIGGRARHDLTD